MNCVWYVRGDPHAENGYFPLFFDDKLSAEKWARQCFPNEDPDKRYARIFFVVVHHIGE